MSPFLHLRQASPLGGFSQAVIAGWPTPHFAEFYTLFQLFAYIYVNYLFQSVL